ncbi:MAG: phosphoribosylamine--glycine ligase [Proteobacteria bacterium]|nr:MAG: phosphoribosylamine--glycine ligase [Pseudomonadota bacterium]TDJ67856.1 MAG: phosphoribosylamine--glycine ligase [Pseudomonadota bacterium]
MKILVIGSGGREHALAWKVAQSPEVSEVYVAPGNAGTALEPKVSNVPIKATDIDGLLQLAQRERIDLTIVGPEAPLVAGIVDAFQVAKLACFGPSKAAARLEGSKGFTKDFLARHNIPTAAYGRFTDLEAATAYIESQGAPIVIKVDGLAAGKGVVLAETIPEAIDAARNMLSGDAFGDAGRSVVVEEFLRGEEASSIVMVDGKHILPFATSQDHKAHDDGDRGPNTGGMGAYSPAPVVTEELQARIMAEIIEPTVQAMAAEGNPYTGFLYAGLMITADSTPKVLEYNCRFGDPEAQPVLLRLKSDLVALIAAALRGQLDKMTIDWDPRVALGVVMASGGYPGSYSKGYVISGLTSNDDDSQKVFHAGTTERDGQIVTEGGRVLCVTALGKTVTSAQTKAYELAQRINWKDVYYRRDIGYRAIARESTT